MSDLGVLVDLGLVLDVLGRVGVAQRAHRLVVVVVCTQTPNQAHRAINREIKTVVTSKRVDPEPSTGKSKQ